MNAIQLLKGEHEKAKRAFAEIREASADRRAELWAQLEPELKAHEQKEEAALYGPVARDVGAKDQTLKEWPEHHHEEVAEAQAQIQEISEMDAATDDWLEKVQDLQEMLEHHIEEEEGDIWPRIQQVWDPSKLEQAAQQMESMKPKKSPRAA